MTMSTEHCENNPDDLPDKRLELRPTTEADRTYIARLNFLTDTFGDEHGTVPAEFDEDFTFYVDDWQPERGGFIAWRGNIPAGGVWLNWGTDERHGYGHAEPGIPEIALAVEGRYKSQGIGTALLHAATELARELAPPGISLSVTDTNTRAARLYRHVGFTDIPASDAHGYSILIKRF